MATAPFSNGKMREVKGNTGKFSGGTGGTTATGKTKGVMVTGKKTAPRMPRGR